MGNSSSAEDDDNQSRCCGGTSFKGGNKQNKQDDNNSESFNSSRKTEQKEGIQVHSMGGGVSKVEPSEKSTSTKEPVDIKLSFGKHVFTGEVAEKYLAPEGLSARDIETPPYSWTTNGQSDKVALAVKAWALEMGATNFCHWFQPIGSSGLRHGQTGQVQLSMLSFKGSTVIEELKVCCPPPGVCLVFSILIVYFTPQYIGKGNSFWRD